MTMMQKHFVTFYSPGTFVAETSCLPIDSWNVDEAREMAHGIKERHGATPWGFPNSSSVASIVEGRLSRGAGCCTLLLGTRGAFPLPIRPVDPRDAGTDT